MTRLVETGGSWSGRERNCCFLNTGTERFADISAVSGLDFIDDGRAVAATDWDLDGDLDLWLTNRTGPRLRFLRNDGSGDAHFLAVRLTGRHTNRDAIGARVEVHLDDASSRKLVRTLYAGDAFLSQSSKWLHFGLGEATSIARVVVRWPGGETETYKDLVADRRYRLIEDGTAEPWTAPERIAVAVDKANAEPERKSGLESSARIGLIQRTPMPQLQAERFDGTPLALSETRHGPMLINLWATWCLPCLKELQAFSDHHDKIHEAGLTIAALSVDGLRGDGSSSPASAKAWAEKRQLPFEIGVANTGLLDKLDVMQDVVLALTTKIDQDLTFPIPSSFLIDEMGRLAVIYHGPVEVDRLLQDVSALPAPENVAVPFPGRWFHRPRDGADVLWRFADRFLRRGHPDEAARYAALTADLVSRDQGGSETRRRLAGVHNDLGNYHDRKRRRDRAEEYYRAALRSDPRSAPAHTNLGGIHHDRGQLEEARLHYQQALAINPNLLQAHMNLANIEFSKERYDSVVGHCRNALKIDPDFPLAHKLLGVALMRQGQYSQAIQHLSEALRLNPNDAEARQYLLATRDAMQQEL